jgi:hypothetical protein
MTLGHERESKTREMSSGLAGHTVAQQVAEMMQLFGACSRCQLIARAYATGILDYDEWPPRLKRSNN